MRGCLTIDRGTKFEKLLFQVLVKIWDKVGEKAEEEVGIILFADGSSLFRFTWPHPYNPNSEVARKRKICMPLGKWIIFFPDSLLSDSDKSIRCAIAHEFAHFMLDHNGGTNHEEHEKGEKAADDLAAKWGFPK